MKNLSPHIQKQFAEPGHLSLPLLLLLLQVLLSACSTKAVDWAGGSSRFITGNFSLGASSLQAAALAPGVCTNPVMHLYELDASGHRKQPELSHASVKGDGTYAIPVRGLGVNLKSATVKYYVEASGCSSLFSRPVTGTKDQNVGYGESLIGFAADSDLGTKLVEANVGQVEALIARLASSGSFADAQAALTSDPATSSLYQAIFPASPLPLADLAPRVELASIPLALSEKAPATFAVTIQHADPGYQAAFLWKRGSVVLGNTSSVTYTPGANEQGPENISLIAGRDDGSGAVDLSKGYVSKTYAAVIADTYPAAAPGLSANATSVNAQSVSLHLSTGAALANCETFSSFALTENDPTEPASNLFTGTCTTAGTQPLPFNLSAGDGSKVIRLWVKDAGGNIGAVPAELTFTLDQTVPTTTLSGPTIANGPFSVTVTFSESVTGLSAADFTVTNGSVTSLTGSGGSYTATVTPSVASGATGVVTVLLPAGRVNDAVSNGNSVSNTVTVNVDKQVPTAMLASGTATPMGAGSINVTATFSEAVDGLDASKFSVSNGSIGSLVGSGSVYSFIITPGIGAGASGEVTLSLPATKVTDHAGNGNSASNSLSWAVDRTAPSVSLTSLTGAQVIAGDNPYTISWTASDANFGANPFTVEFSSDSGATWANVVSGLGAAVRSYSWTPTATVAGLNTSTARVRVSAVDSLGNGAYSSSGSDFTVDSTAPALDFLRVNNNDPVTLSAILSVKIEATDSLSGVKEVRFATASSSCQAEYRDADWLPFINGGGQQTYAVATTLAKGSKRLCGWARDNAGNVSTISANAGNGTDGLDSDEIFLDMGNAPGFTLLKATNGNSGSPKFGTMSFDVGDPVKVEFSLADDSALAEYPLEMYVSINSGPYNRVATATDMGSPGIGQTSWSGSYSGYAATFNGFFRVRLLAKDANGNTAAALTSGLNTGKWTYFAGNTDLGDGGSALAARIPMSGTDSGVKTPVAVTKKNEIFIATPSNIRKIDPLTGNISTYLTFGAHTGVPGTITSSTRIFGYGNIAADDIFLYVLGIGRIYRINTETNYVELYAGGGSSVSSGDPQQANFWASLGLTIDPATKDLYVATTCTDADQTSLSAAPLKIRRITQDSSTKQALAIEDFAGNCVAGTPVNGADKLSSPITANIVNYRYTHSPLVYIPSTGALYFQSPGGQVVKIKGGKVYSGATALGLNGAIYIPQQNRVYFASSSLFYFTPSSSDALDETRTLYLNHESNCAVATCRDDGVAIANAAFNSTSLFNVAGQLGFVDNLFGPSAIGRLMMVDSGSGKVAKLAGTDRFQGDGSDANSVFFGGLYRLAYKAVSQAGFPAGLYAGDGGSGRLVQIDPVSQIATVRAGAGIYKAVSEGAAFGVGAFLGQSSGTYDLGNFTFNPAGLFTYFMAGRITNIKPDLTTEFLLNNTGGLLFGQADGISGKNYRLCNPNETNFGFVYDSASNLYFGGYRSDCSPAPNKIMVRKANGIFNTVIGSNTTAVSPDCASPGCARNSTLGCSMTAGAGGCPIAPFDERAGRLLFAEQGKVRYVTDPTNPLNSTLGTLFTAGRSVGAISYTYVDPVDTANGAIDRVFYISGDGKLYCKKISAGVDASCDNATSLGPNFGTEVLGQATVTQGASGELYMTNSTNTGIFRYQP